MKHVSEGKPLFTGESLYQRIACGFCQALTLAGIVYCALNFNENPVAVSIFIIFLVLLFIISGNTTVYVYPDRIEFHDINFWLPFIRQKIRAYYHEIESIDAHLKYGIRELVIEHIVSSRHSLGFFNTVKIKMKSGKERYVVTKLLKNKIEVALKHVDDLTDHTITIT